MAQRWYPTKQQLRDPDSVERSFRQLLDQHYALQDKFDALQRQSTAPASSVFPPGSGPSDTVICGLHVAPVDTNSLANGATLKFVKKDGNFQFS